MKASAQNFMGSLALGENVSSSLNQMMTSASTFFFGNFIPMLGTIIKSLPAAIGTFLSQGVPMLLSNISNLISTLATNITSVANGLTSGKVQQWASTTIPRIISAAGQMIAKFASSLLANLPKIAVALVKIGAAIVKGLGSALWGKVTAAANGIRDRFMAPIDALKAKVKTAIDKVKSLFPFNIGKVMSNIKLPHFSISGKFGLNPPQTPKLSIKWFAKGGIVDGPTLFGAGEAGPEAIMPLDRLKDFTAIDYDRFASAMVRALSTVNLTSTVNVDGREVARTTAPFMQSELNRIQTRNDRRLGYI